MKNMYLKIFSLFLFAAIMLSACGGGRLDQRSDNLDQPAIDSPEENIIDSPVDQPVDNTVEDPNDNTVTPPPVNSSPFVISTSPTGEEPVFTNVSISIEFSEEMLEETINTSNIQLFSKYPEPEPVSGTVSLDGVNAIFTPDDLLNIDGSYVVVVKGASSDASVGVKDLEGNLMEEDYVFEFSTSFDDLSAYIGPSVVSVSPKDGAQYVPINSKIVIEFSKEMLAESVNASTIELFVLYPDVMKVEGSVECSGTTAVFTPQVNLEVDNNFKLIIHGKIDGVKDASGNSMTMDKVIEFTSDF